MFVCIFRELNQTRRFRFFFLENFHTATCFHHHHQNNFFFLFWIKHLAIINFSHITNIIYIQCMRSSSTADIHISLLFFLNHRLWISHTYFLEEKKKTFRFKNCFSLNRFFDENLSQRFLWTDKRCRPKFCSVFSYHIVLKTRQCLKCFIHTQSIARSFR